MENQESGEGNTQGNSWGESFGTIGKAKAKQEQTNEKQQEFDTETIGGKRIGRNRLSKLSARRRLTQEMSHRKKQNKKIRKNQRNQRWDIVVFSFLVLCLHRLY